MDSPAAASASSEPDERDEDEVEEGVGGRDEDSVTDEQEDQEGESNTGSTTPPLLPSPPAITSAPAQPKLSSSSESDGEQQQDEVDSLAASGATPADSEEKRADDDEAVPARGGDDDSAAALQQCQQQHLQQQEGESHHQSLQPPTPSTVVLPTPDQSKLSIESMLALLGISTATSMVCVIVISAIARLGWDVPGAIRSLSAYVFTIVIFATYMLATWLSHVTVRGWYESRGVLYLSLGLPATQVGITALLELWLQDGITTVYYWRIDFVLFVLMVILSNMLTPISIALRKKHTLKLARSPAAVSMLPQPQPQKFSIAPFLIFAYCFLMMQYLVPAWFARGALTSQGRFMQLLYVVVVHPLMAMGLSTLFSISFVKARRNKWATGAEAAKLTYNMVVIVSAMSHRAMVGLLPNTAADGEVSTQLISVLALGTIEVAIRATAASRKRLWGKLAMGQDYAPSEWESHLESLAVQAVASSHVEITGIIVSGFGHYYLRGFEVFLSSSGTAGSGALNTGIALVLELIVDSVSFCFEAREGMNFSLLWSRILPTELGVTLVLAVFAQFVVMSSLAVGEATSIMTDSVMANAAVVCTFVCLMAMAFIAGLRRQKTAAVHAANMLADKSTEASPGEVARTGPNSANPVAAKLNPKKRKLSFAESHGLPRANDEPVAPSTARSLRSLRHAASDTVRALADPSDGTESAEEARANVVKGIFPFVGCSLMFTALVAVPGVGVFSLGPWSHEYWRPLTAPIIVSCMFNSLYMTGFSINYVDVMGWEIARPILTPGLLIAMAVMALTVLPAALFGVDMGGAGIQFGNSAVGMVTFLVTSTFLLAKSKRRVEGSQGAVASAAPASSVLREAPKAQPGRLLFQWLPSLMILSLIYVASAIARAFPTWSTQIRFYVRIVGWPVLQVLGSGIVRQAVVLGGGSARAAKLQAGVMFCYQGTFVHEEVAGA
mmetsp:Transcript_884/g.1767  ORF Transcript_884/g.1767 Transcript_884/m.1767 type:complete len:953 (-) Transcript_884:963-3821(-)